mmetsp:Transcript_46786/g.130259  ORF Transcript_46786/g.130259 Transcript_46786/m.130259 type:complete len:208 (+) Transcript_46786:185-808(+)
MWLWPLTAAAPHGPAHAPSTFGMRPPVCCRLHASLDSSHSLRTITISSSSLFLHCSVMAVASPRMPFTDTTLSPCRTSRSGCALFHSLTSPSFTLSIKRYPPSVRSTSTPRRAPSWDFLRLMVNSSVFGLACLSSAAAGTASGLTFSSCIGDDDGICCTEASGCPFFTSSPAQHLAPILTKSRGEAGKWKGGGWGVGGRSPGRTFHP